MLGERHTYNDTVSLLNESMFHTYTPVIPTLLRGPQSLDPEGADA